MPRVDRVGDEVTVRPARGQGGKEWWLYMAVCNDGTVYVGITVDVPRRIQEHNGRIAGKGAAYTKTRRPVVLVYDRPLGTTHKGEAEREERATKKLPHRTKLWMAADQQAERLGGDPHITKLKPACPHAPVPDCYVALVGGRDYVSGWRCDDCPAKGHRALVA